MIGQWFLLRVSRRFVLPPDRHAPVVQLHLLALKKELVMFVLSTRLFVLEALVIVVLINVLQLCRVLALAVVAKPMLMLIVVPA